MITCGRSVAVALVLVSLAGCQMVTSDAKERARLAAYAGNITYPAGASVQTAQVGALISHDEKTLRVVNFSDKDMTNMDVWINRVYVRHVDSLAARSSVDLDLSRFYSKDGSYFGQNEQPKVELVQLESGGALYALLGPVRE